MLLLPWRIDYIYSKEENKLGEGSFGKVIRAFDPLRKKNIAVKLIKCNSEN